MEPGRCAVKSPEDGIQGGCLVAERRYPVTDSRTLPHAWPSSRPEAPIVPLAYRLREAAAAIGVSERTLWTWAQNGDVPCVHRGRCVLFPVDALRRWLDEQAQASAPAKSSQEADQ